MRNLITAQEVIDLAFAENSNMMAESISDTAIRIAEIKYIRPAFGVMYPLLADKYADFTNDYVKPALAYFVKCEIVSSIAIDMSNSGVAVANPQYQSAATDKQRQRLYDSEMSKAKTLLDFALEYIATHSEEFPDFSGEAPKKHHRVGGILLGGGTSRSQSASIAGEAFKDEIERLSKDVEGKVDKVHGKGLSTNDFTDEYKQKVDEFNGGGGGGGSITIDKELSPTSDNAIANSAVVQGLAGLAEGVSEAIENVAKNVEQNTADIKTKQNTLTLTTKPNGNIVIGNLAGQSKEFMPATPSGDPMHYMYLKTYGLSYDETTGLWAYRADEGGLTDLTTEEVQNMWLVAGGLDEKTNNNCRWARKINALLPARTNICSTYYGSGQGYTDTDWDFAFNQNSTIEVAVITTTPTTYYSVAAQPYHCAGMFAYCGKLRKIIGGLSFDYIYTKDSRYTNMFTQCPLLESVEIWRLNRNLGFPDSPLLSKESLLFMINNCESNATFTITLHPDVYAKCTDADNGEWYDDVVNAIDTVKTSKGTTITLASA